jgi:hypothetical protein
MPNTASGNKCAIPSGNYPEEIWPKIVTSVKSNDYLYWQELVHNAPRNVNPPYFLVIDIHGFSGLCQKFATRSGKKGMRKVALFLRAFFMDMAEVVHSYGGTCVKFIGDAILATHEEKEHLIKMGIALLKRYHGNFRTTYDTTNAVVVITRPRECLKGFVMGNQYVDYSFWSPGLNYLFGQTKVLPEGQVYFIEENGGAHKCHVGTDGKVKISKEVVRRTRE